MEAEVCVRGEPQFHHIGELVLTAQSFRSLLTGLEIALVTTPSLVRV